MLYSKSVPILVLKLIITVLICGQIVPCSVIADTALHKTPVNSLAVQPIFPIKDNVTGGYTALMSHRKREEAELACVIKMATDALDEAKPDNYMAGWFNINSELIKLYTDGHPGETKLLTVIDFPRRLDDRRIEIQLLKTAEDGSTGAFTVRFKGSNLHDMIK